MFTRQQWFAGEYPFDFASCGNCLTMHKITDCVDTEHAGYREAVRDRLAGLRDYSDECLDRFAVTILELRAEFDHFYPKRTVQGEPVVEPELVECT